MLFLLVLQGQSIWNLNEGGSLTSYCYHLHEEMQVFPCVTTGKLSLYSQVGKWDRYRNASRPMHPSHILIHKWHINWFFSPSVWGLAIQNTASCIFVASVSQQHLFIIFHLIELPFSPVKSISSEMRWNYLSLACLYGKFSLDS